MNEINSKAINELVRSISHLINKKCKKLYYDKTFLSLITNITKNGKYVIIKDGQKYTVTNSTNFELKIGQLVWIKIPSGIIEDMHICGIKS